MYYFLKLKRYGNGVLIVLVGFVSLEKKAMALHHSFLNSIVFVRSRTNELGKEKRVRDDFHFAHAAYRRHNERDHEEASPKTDLVLGDLKLCERGHIRSLQSSLYVVVRRR